MEILVHHQMRILNKIANALKFHLESPDNSPVVIVSGFVKAPDEIINQEDTKEEEIIDPEFESIIFNNTEDIEVCIENFKSNSVEKIVSVVLIKNKEIMGDERFPLTKLNAKLNIADIEFEV